MRIPCRRSDAGLVGNAGMETVEGEHSKHAKTYSSGPAGLVDLRRMHCRAGTVHRRRAHGRFSGRSVRGDAVPGLDPPTGSGNNPTANGDTLNGDTLNGTGAYRGCGISSDAQNRDHANFHPGTHRNPHSRTTRPGATWRGITVAPEERCSPYDSDNYPYPPSVEPRIVEELGGVYGPYTGTWFGSMKGNGHRAQQPPRRSPPPG